MLISHEAPLDIMESVREFTDYDYCLVHLLEESEKYVDYFLNSKKNNRKIIMDCSLYELGSAFDIKKYIKWIDKIQPTQYIVPDVWQDYAKNISNYKNFTSKYKNLPGSKMGVLQGSSMQELIESYKFMSQEADVVCISFGYDYYWNLFNKHIPIEYAEDQDKETTKRLKPLSFCNGRLFLINLLMSMNLIEVDKPHHLLGCGSPNEFLNYRYYNFIQSADTSHPVLLGLENKSYNDKNINFYKPTFKINDIFFKETTKKQLCDILTNIKMFKKYYRNYDH